MTLTSNTMEWLNQNRHRAYPFASEEWRSRVASDGNAGLDCVLLDALVFDADSNGDETLVMESVEVTPDKVKDNGAVVPGNTVVWFKYGDTRFKVMLSGGDDSGEGSYECYSGALPGNGVVRASVSLALSSHAYIQNAVGAGSWEIGCCVLPTRVISLTDGEGVEKIITNGSCKVRGNEEPADVSGDVVLEDGYRTSPVVYNGDVLVRVGKRYGYDPCHYDYGEKGSVDCRNPLFFFCGQNAVNSGNVILSGGQGVSVTQGGTYTIDDESSKCNGMTIPCIEITAGRELRDMSATTEVVSAEDDEDSQDG